jgi:NADPH:quinone reductase-like Zn-dependent oxidoreductase
MLGSRWRPGIDAAGVVEQAARHGHGPRPGERVVVHAPGGGLAAELAAVPVTRAVPLPEDVSMTDAATIPLAGIVALRLLRESGQVQGKRILMTGATGGVGQFLVQLAAADGADVTVLSPGQRPHTHLTQLGARVVHDIDPAGQPFDIVLESTGGAGGSTAIGAVAPHGLVLWYGQAGGEPVTLDFFGFLGPHQSFTLRHYVVASDPGRDRADITTLVGHVASGRLKPVLGYAGPWHNAPALFRQLGTRGLHGKAVLTLPAR